MMVHLNRAPLIGILAFIVVLLVMPLGHTVMVLIEHLFGDGYQYLGAGILGALGAAILIYGSLNQSETSATWYGFFAGIFLWTGWVEFSFVYYAQQLGVLPLMENGEVVTKPEYLLMPSSIGLLFSTMLFFFLNKNSGCRFFIFLRGALRMSTSDCLPAKKRNFAAITALETIFIIWTFYLLLLVAYDKNFFGDRHPFTYLVFFGSLVWSLFLFNRLIKIRRIAPAVRYAIPTVVIFWNSVEILGRWNFFKEIWIYPAEHGWEVLLIFLAFLIVTVLTLLTSQRRSALSSLNDG